ncbi:DUF721 domain-containing protein [Deinococcus cellulosilyticus]|uniref:DUF721 domain-containing protein n=1 Tax=Deinococcus cellulosilyticus (strain DSM 18568 / NBRC 106333 / KACC 11606 / 5516J-15) TaxID=1223518 RepID=A0A511N3Q8_DEIC1|nr:DUF721 domain-containing protein [Deinococcus cellulosilyticus]GEM47509.1 hypothetical protein DC3_31440 [Deinococcus cellulosilyticus NBRC 106333 = KACC 11606]
MKEFNDLLFRMMRRQGIQGGVERARAVAVWPQVVGPQLSKMTRARAVQDRVLIVEVQDSVVAHHLSLQRTRFVSKLSEVLGEGKVQDIKFVVGTVHTPVDQPRPTPPPKLTARDLETVEHMLEGVPEHFRDTARKAAEAVLQSKRLRHQKGFKPCPACKTLTDREDLCLPCRDLTLSTQVQAVAKKLQANPDLQFEVSKFPFLTEDGMKVAAHLAFQQVQKQLSDVLLEFIQSKGETSLQKLLQERSYVMLALEYHQKLDSIDRKWWKKLPEPVQHALKVETYR